MLDWRLHSLRWCLTVLVTFGSCAEVSVEDGVVIGYEGQLMVLGMPFSGVGRFRFALVDGSGVTQWESDPAGGSVKGTRILVREGRYSVRIGDPDLGHPVLPGSVGASPEALCLRVFFSDGDHGWDVAGTDSLVGIQARASVGDAGAEIAKIRRELDELRTQLAAQKGGAKAPNRGRAPEPPRPVSIDWPNAPALGATNAPLVLMEFADFECPACRRTHENLFNAIVTNYVDVGTLLFVSRQLPLPQHKKAPGAARAAYCAGREGLYFEMYDRLFSDKTALETNGVMAAASDLGLNVAEFASCMADPEHEMTLRKEISDASAIGVTATPSFILGRRSGDKLNGVLIVGGRSLQFFQEEIARMLKSPP